MNILNKYEELIALINYHSNLYYNEDDPEISDYEFDMMMLELKQIEKEYPELIVPDSPSQRVGGNQGKSTFEKVEHAVPMLSLQDVFSIEDVEKFLEKFSDDTYFVVEEKYDGLSMSVTYENGILTKAETRGDGYIGENITEHAKYIKGLPLVLTGNKIDVKSIKLLEVRCEVCLPKDAFTTANIEREKNGKEPFKNLRNAAAGLLRTKNIEDMKNAGLTAFVFNLQRIEFYNPYDDKFNSWTKHFNSLCSLQDLGFNISKTTNEIGERVLRCVPKNDVISEIERIGEYKSSLPYDVDGAVIKVDDFDLRNKLGETSKYPKWAVAYKYPPEEQKTIVRDIILQTGRTGRVTPVAIFDPIFIGGTTVERAVLNNQEFINKLNINIGDKILVHKAAEIVPEIINIVSKGKNKEPYKILNHTCPSCGNKLALTDSGIGMCNNSDCPAQIANKFVFWGSRDCMDIRGFGPAVVEKLIDNGFLNEIPDIYRLAEHQWELEQLEGFSEKSVKNLLNAIEKSKNHDIDRLIKALGIVGVGRHVGKILSSKYPVIYEIGAYSVGISSEEKINELKNIEGVGPVLAETICQWFNKAKNINMLFDLAKLGVNVYSKSYNKNIDNDLPLKNKTFVITGTLPTLKRSEAQKLIEENGGKVVGSISKKVNYLLVGENAGSKLTKAKELGIEIISEDDFTNMIL